MVPLQSLACETPVIAPQITGLADYLNVDNAMVLQTRGRVAGKDENPLVAAQNNPDATGHYHGIDEEHLVDCMVSLANNWAREKKKAEAAGPWIRENYSWERVSQPLLELISRELAVPGTGLTGLRDKLP